MPNIRDIDIVADRPIQALIMGPPGVGKTFLAGTFSRPNFMDFDGKIGVLRNPAFLRKFGSRSIEYKFFPEQTLVNPKLIPNAFDDACRYFDEWMKPAKRDAFDTWVIDSGTSLSLVARAKGIYILGQSNRSKARGISETHGIPVMERQDWGVERDLVEKFIRMIRDSGKNMLVNVHEKNITNDQGFLLAVKPLFTGQSSDVVPAMVPDVWLLKVSSDAKGRPIRVLTGEPYARYEIRSELGLDEITDPSYEKIISRIKQLQQEALSLSQKAPTLSGATPAASVPATP